MPAEPSKYALNQFDSSTVGRPSLMDEFLADLVPRATAATAGIADFSSVMSELGMLIGAWDGSFAAWTIARNCVPSCTYDFEDKMASLTRPPNANEPSPLETWDATIRTQVAYQGPVYMILLPNGREALTHGTYESRLDTLTNLGTNLALQVTKPVLVTLGTTVTAFANAARTLRTAQTTAKAEVEITRNTLETRRIACANVVYKLTGCGMMVWNATPDLVDTLYDISILRRPVKDPPDAPADTTWTPATRTLSTLAMPARATRLQAWRIAPGGMPEMLHTGISGETFVTIPNTITWTSGELYQLWLLALNGSGESVPGPVQTWTAP